MLDFKWDKNQFNWVSIYLFSMFISYEGHRCKIENEGDSNTKLMRRLAKLKHQVKSYYNGIVIHDCIIWLVCALIVEDIILILK